MKKITVTLPETSVQAIRTLVHNGQADSVSGFVQHAVARSLEDSNIWAQILTEALAETGGELTASEREWAEHILQGKNSGAA